MTIAGALRIFKREQFLFLRFEDYCIPYVDDIKEGRSEDYTWEALDDKRSEWWTAAADSARERFVAEGHHVLVRDPSDWVGVARRHLVDVAGRIPSRRIPFRDHRVAQLVVVEVD